VSGATSGVRRLGEVLWAACRFHRHIHLSKWLHNVGTAGERPSPRSAASTYRDMLQSALTSCLFPHSVALVRERTIPTARLPLVGEVSANFCGWRVSRGQSNGSLRPYSGLSTPKPLLFLPSNSSIVLTRLSGPRCRPTTSQKMW
jgi:hypothetical protein